MYRLWLRKERRLEMCVINNGVVSLQGANGRGRGWLAQREQQKITHQAVRHDKGCVRKLVSVGCKDCNVAQSQNTMNLICMTKFPRLCTQGLHVRSVSKIVATPLLGKQPLASYITSGTKVSRRI
ncbi:hypothetical protein E2C01_053238 [Portunus trituberculatus]|uniref:Uncharacterized protein n=1 Tax=Portunus trituberculatus TaxID=210409 RepID=A0A5B7GJR7_PORTR|nr:hypothetical protein [Portunus trituberculatus]